MHQHIHVFGISIPSYGLLISIGVVIANVIAFIDIQKKQLDINDFLILEGYCFLGGVIGSKLLYIIISIKEIDWYSIHSFSDFADLMNGGFVFYGGLIGGILTLIIGGSIHRLQTNVYISEFIFLLPMIHAFGRVGCFLAGCCYGIPYEGFGAVVYPENSFAVSGVKLFPIQLVECFLLFLISFVLLVVIRKSLSKNVLELYFLLYGMVRIITEYFRYDAIRGKLGWFSTSQWISIGFIIFAIVSINVKRRKHNYC